MSREKDDNIKINIPLFTNLELEEFDFKLDNYLDSIVQEVSKAVLHDKENILLQKVVQKLEKELEQEKEKNKELCNGTFESMKRILGEEFTNRYISKDKIRTFIKEEIKEGTYNFKTISAKRLRELLEE